MRAAKLAEYPLLLGAIRLRWQFGNTGVHSENHFQSDGISLGIRYNSNLTYKSETHQPPPPVESAPSIYYPCITPGARLPHLQFSDGSVLNDFVETSGYTLLIVNAAEISTVDAYAKFFDLYSEPFIFILTLLH